MNDKSLRAKIRNMAKDKKVNPQLLMQNYFLERLLYRVSISPYKENIVLKGGLLMASLLGVDKRTTMDMDVSIKDYPVNEVDIVNMIEKLLLIETEDGMAYTYVDIRDISHMDEDPEYRIRIIGHFGRVNQSLSIDVSTGDVITPKQISYDYQTLFGSETISVKTYNIESVLAEKIETVISRRTSNKRMTDFYDLYMLWKLKKPSLNLTVFREATKNTFENKDTLDLTELKTEIIGQISHSDEMLKFWEKYRAKNTYVQDLEFSQVMTVIHEIVEEAF